MAKLRHLALSVPNVEAAASFYEKVFGMERVKQSDDGVAVTLADGVVSVTILKFPTDEMAGDERGKDFVGIHHMGFVVDDLEQTSHLVEQNGGTRLGDPENMTAEAKCTDLNGILFDIVSPDRAWKGSS